MSNKLSVKEFTLDYSKWRCGYTTPDLCKNQLGMGAVRMLNAEGYSCCIGQFSQQLGIDKDSLIDKSSPADVRTPINLFNKPSATSGYNDTALTEDCIVINDDPKTTPQEKIALLSDRLAKEGISLKVINQPKLRHQ